jgi:hypothetical protein
MSEMCESVNITNQGINKLAKFNKIKNICNTSRGQKTSISNIAPKILTKYLSHGVLNKGNVNNSYTSMEHLIKHFKF